MRLTVRRRGYVLIREANFGRTALRALLQAIADPGLPVDAELRRRLCVHGTPPSLPVPARVPALPLHRDAVLVEAPGELLGFSALATDPAFDAGALELVDSVTALTEFPTDLLRVLASRAFEYRLRDCSPFPNVPPEWFVRPTFVRAAAGRALNIVLPPTPRPGIAAPWETRLRGLGPRASADQIARVDDHLRASSTFRSHTWSTADAVVVDNSRVLHGIAAVPAAARHHVIRESL
nr:TauD/TfdA family dioxygenase [Nocardia bovistercoris]